MHRFYHFIVRYGFLLILFVYFCVHGALFVFDLENPKAFLHGDRAADRIAHIAHFMSAPSNYVALLTAPFPGDFAVQAVLYRFGGQYFVIGVQIFLQFAILAGVYLCTLRLMGRRAALAAGLLLIAMPGTLMNTHMLVTEPWFAAFLSVGILFFCLSVNDQRELESLSYLSAGFLSLTLAMFIRPQGLLLPLAMAAALMAIAKGSRVPIFVGVAASYLVFPLSLMIFRLLSIGEFGLGESNADLGINLLLRANRILYGSYYELGEKLTISQFLSIAASHPLATVNTFYADAVNLFLNPGNNAVFGFYLGLYNPEDFRFWVGLLDRAGPTGVIAQVVREEGPFVTTFVIWTVVHIVVLIGVGTACVRALRERNITPLWVWLVLVGVGVYLATAFASGQLRWSHRAGIEPLLVILVAWSFFSPTSSKELARQRGEIPSPSIGPRSWTKSVGAGERNEAIE